MTRSDGNLRMHEELQEADPIPDAFPGQDPKVETQISTMTAWKHAWFKAHAKPTDGQDLRPSSADAQRPGRGAVCDRAALACRALAVHWGCLAWPGAALGGVRRAARPMTDKQAGVLAEPHAR